MVPLAPGQLVAVPWEDDNSRPLPNDFRIIEIVTWDNGQVTMVAYGDHLSSVPNAIDPAALTPHQLHAATGTPTFTVPLTEFVSWEPTLVPRPHSH